METSDVRKRVLSAMEHARKNVAGRREEHDRADRAFYKFLGNTAVARGRHVGNVHVGERYPFSVFTPSGSVKMMSDRSPEDFIEILLDESGEHPRVVGHVKRTRGSRVIETEKVVGSGDPETLTAEELLGFLLKEIEPFVER
jgi:hypothetical protein